MEIISHKPINKGFLIAECSLMIPKWGDVIIENIKVFKKENQHWIQFPSKEYEKDGQKKFFPLIRFKDKNMQDNFQRAFFQAYDKFVQLKNHEQFAGAEKVIHDMGEPPF